MIRFLLNLAQIGPNSALNSASTSPVQWKGKYLRRRSDPPRVELPEPPMNRRHRRSMLRLLTERSALVFRKRTADIEACTVSPSMQNACGQAIYD